MHLSDLKLFTHLQDFHTDFQSKSYIFQHQVFTASKAKQNFVSRTFIFLVDWRIDIYTKSTFVVEDLNRHFIRRKDR